MKFRMKSCEAMVASLRPGRPHPGSDGGARRRHAFLSLLLSGFLILPAGAETIEIPATLTWRNGDRLEGSLLASEGPFIQWKTPLFARPFTLDLRQLEGVRFSTLAAEETAAERPPFRLLLNNGDRLDGWLEAITADAVTFRALPFIDPVEIRRESIEKLVHLGSQFLRYSGPGDIGEWSSSGRDRKTSEWFTDLAGAFATHQWSGNLFREIEFPASVEIRFRAAFPMGSPNLEIGLVRGADTGPMIETWDDALVLTYRTRFVPVMQLGEDTRELDFRLFWNQSSGEVLLCDPAGKQLAALENARVERRAPDSTKSRNSDPLVRGFSILNRSPELKLLSLSVQEWDGRPPALIDVARPRVLLVGRTPRFETNAVSYRAGSESIRVGSQSFPLAEFQELILTADPDPGDTSVSSSTTRLAWHDGSNVSGELRELTSTEMTLATAWSTTPLQISLDKAREIRFPESEALPASGSDRLEIEGTRMTGTAQPLARKSGNSFVGWLPPGGREAVPFSDEVEATITRFPHASANPELAGLISQARLYLTNDEILVGSLLSATPQEVKFTSRITGAVTIPASQLRAVDIGSAGRILEGFDDSEWEKIETPGNDIELSRDTAVMRTGGFGHPSLILGDRIHFTAKWKQTYGALTLRLFTNGPDENAPSTDLIIAAQGNRLFVGKLKESGAFSFSGDQIPITGDTASFEIRLRSDLVEVIVNERTSLEIQVEADRVSGNGIYFKMGGGWQGWNQADNEITITGFRIERTPGSIPRRIIDPAAREISLQLPRSRRDPAPEHLLVAPNGDLLRGNLISATAAGIRFQAGESTLELPTDRVSALIWLREEAAGESGGKQTDGETEEVVEKTAQEVAEEPGEGTGSAPSTSSTASAFPVTHQFVLMDGSRLNLRADKLDDERFVGQSSLLGTCSIAVENIREMKRGPETPATELETAVPEAYRDWVLKPTPEPAIPGTGEEAPSPLIGKKAPSIELTMLDESVFKLSDQRGKVVVLDFWATWCGPCIKAIPDVTRVVAAFPEGTVTLCAVNQSESLPIINRFLESRKWTDLPVALDFDMKVSQSYLVTAIPHTVVIGKDGNVAWVHSGYTGEFKSELFEAIAKEVQK